MNQPSKGTTSHTSSFMEGYYNGYRACSVSSPAAQQPSGPTAQQQPTTNTTHTLGNPSGTSSPAMYPQINMATIDNTTVTVSHAINATPASNEHDYKLGFKDGFNDYNGSSKDNSDLSSFVNSNDDVDDCQVVHYTLGTHRELTGIPVLQGWLRCWMGVLV